MVLKRSTILGFILYFSLGSLILSPFIAKFFGIPRLDSLLAPLYTLLVLYFLLFYGINKRVKSITIVLIGISLFAFLSLILSFNVERLIDVFYISFLVYLFYFSFIYIKNSGYSSKIIRRLFEFLLFIIFLGFFIEIIFGVQLVIGDEQLSILNNSFKGFFFNTNDQAVVVTSLSAAICFFYIIGQHDKKVRYLGYFLLLVSAVIVFVSASRAALLGFILILIFTLFLNANKYLKLVYAILAIVISTFIFNINFLIPVFNFLSRYSWLERSVERFELAIFSLDSDNSVDYRVEVYQKFFENFKVVWLGYGPRNYFDYFAQNQLSYALGYTNPHSFFIEIYLAFGIFALIFFLAFLVISIYEVFNKSSFLSSQKIFYLVTLLLFCWLVWVPSSIFRLPLVWFSVFIIFIYSKNNNLAHRYKND
jgi:O-antigen ligase